VKNVLTWLFSLSIFFISSCSQDPNEITIKGSIANPISDELVFNFPDTSYEAKVDADGNFKITLNQDSAQYVTLLHGERTRMFIKPGDNIEVYFDTKEFDETMTYKYSPESSFLAYKLILTEEGDFYGKSLYLADKVSYEVALENFKSNLMQKLDHFENGYFKITEQKSINVSVERYLKRKESFSDRTEEELLYLWEASKLSKEYNFYGLLSTLNRAKFDENLVIYEKKMNSALEPLKKLNNYEEEQGKITKIVASWSERKDDYDNMPKNGDMSIDFSYPNSSSEMVSLSSFKGRLVYIDIWATWCGPCIAEIPSLKRLQKDYENMDIIFLSISVDTDKEAWKKMLIEEQLGGVQLWADGWSQITKSYAIFGIPRFMLVDKSGELIAVDAPRPSSNEIRSMIDERI
tara:strand:+ start:21 stop:1238 length:1218 start_codon:yes stop_codon:yes gene_type:complete